MPKNKESKEKTKTSENIKSSREIRRLKRRRKRYRRIIIGILIFVLFVFSVIFALININNEKIYNNVSVMGIDVSNLTLEEARKTVSDKINEKLSKDIILNNDSYCSFLH